MMSLPILNSRFFQEHRPDLGFFSKWSSFYTWNEQLLPVYEWQDILYVGCSRPPKSFPIFSGQKVVLVLCEPGVLQDLWLDFQSPMSSAPSRNFSLEPAPPSSHFSGLPQLPEAQELAESLEDSIPDFQHLETVVMKDPKSDQPVWDAPVESEIPNLNLEENFKLEENLDLKDSFDLKEDQEPEEKTAALQEAIPEGLSLDAIPTDEFSLEAPAEPSAPAPFELQDDPPAELASSNSEETEAAAELLDLGMGTDSLSAAGNTGPVTLTPLEPVGSTKTDLSLNFSNSKNTDESTAPMIENSAPKEVRATPVSSEALVMGDVTRIAHRALDSVPKNNLEPWLEKIFQQMDEKFEKTMVLLKTGDQVRPWKWDANFEQDTARQTVISLVQPSPFRIVARTKKSYHGYVVPSEQLQKFCLDWNFSQTPEHLTIAPILVEDHVVGLVLAMGSKASDTKENLMLAEMMALEMSQKIKATPQPGRAA